MYTREGIDEIIAGIRVEIINVVGSITNEINEIENQIKTWKEQLIKLENLVNTEINQREFDVFEINKKFDAMTINRTDRSGYEKRCGVQ